MPLQLILVRTLKVKVHAVPPVLCGLRPLSRSRSSSFVTFLCVLQDYLLSHMYSNAARDDLWSKLSQVRLTC